MINSPMNRTRVYQAQIVNSLTRPGFVLYLRIGAVNPYFQVSHI